MVETPKSPYAGSEERTQKIQEQPAVFLDRDGVINHNRSDYVKSWAEFRFLPGALHAMRQLATLDCPVVIVTNQSAVGRRLVAPEIIEDIHDNMVAAIHQAGGRVDSVLYCPHAPDHHCSCRKPKPGLLRQAQKQLGLDLGNSYLVGDAASDIAAAQAAGCRPILVKTGRGIEQLALLRSDRSGGFRVAENLGEAVQLILVEQREHMENLE